MNKQQLASKIWESANKMRSKIEANEYKDYILGFMFYKFLSDKEEKEFRTMGVIGDLSFATENNSEFIKENMEEIQKRLGYFISYENLFSTWIKIKSDFNVSNVRDALKAFDRLISPSHKKVFEGIFDTLQTGLSKLGDSTTSQSAAVRDLLDLIKLIPMDNKQDYDVLGFVYEYLISNFAANAGKKAGEFYTPHEVSQVMSDIIADFLNDRDSIEIYDPTSGSGSLLLNIGNSVSKFIKDPNRIKYYAQELKKNTYNLTRMNLVMRGILPSNIVARNGDTLEDDWPFFDENHDYTPLFIDAVVSNPPYSQPWNSKDKETDSRYKNYGLAPKTKADYAFLLHDLYHLKSDGIMTIVLPHGVLFRGGEERKIRKNLIEKNNIDAVIGLPANIFFGTGIPTVIMILKKQKDNTNIQIIDASKEFIKEGKNNKLSASNIKKIVDTVINRIDVEKYSKIVTLEEIRENDYNLNIPRYVDSSDEQESFDIYASMFGGIPKNELKTFDNFFEVFQNLKKDLFDNINDKYYKLEKENVYDFIKNHKDVVNYKSNFNNKFKDFNKYLSNELICNVTTLNLSNMESKISSAIFNRFDDLSLIDKYKAYQILDDEWTKISGDIELIQNEGINCCTKVDPKIEIKKKNGKDEEVQVGWQGHIIPFDIIQNYKLNNEKEIIEKYQERLEEITSEYQETIESFSEEDKEELKEFLNENNDGFNFKEISKKVKELNKIAKILENDSLDLKILNIDKLSISEKDIKNKLKESQVNLENNTKTTIEQLNDEDITTLLSIKWIKPIVDNINKMAEDMINDFTKQVEIISKKYEITLLDLENEISASEKQLSNMIDELTGDEFDMKGLKEFKILLNGGDNE